MRHLVTFNFYKTSFSGPFLLSSTNMVLMTLTDGRHTLVDDNLLPNLKYFNFHLGIKVQASLKLSFHCTYSVKMQ